MDKCDQIADVDPHVVSKNLAIYANSVRSYGRYKALNVYISAPPSELELILRLKAVIVEQLGISVFTFEGRRALTHPNSLIQLQT